jgi:proline racemase
MFDKRRYFMENMDDIRLLLMNEPRGHSAMSGAILQPSTRPDCQWGVVYIEVSGCLPMCGHGTIGVATVLVNEGLVEVTEGVTHINLDTPAGLVGVDVKVEGGKARQVALTNVASFTVGLDRVVDVPGIGPVKYDMAFGGNFYAIVPIERIGVEFDRANKDEMLAIALRMMDAINETDEPVHPENPEIRGCHHIYLEAPGSTAQHSRHAMAIHPGWFDRSPCGTGTSARMAQLHTRGLLPLNTDFVNESFIGTNFIGRLLEETTVGEMPAVIPTVTGRAWITGHAEYTYDPTDPFPTGFEL